MTHKRPTATAQSALGSGLPAGVFTIQTCAAHVHRSAVGVPLVCARPGIGANVSRARFPESFTEILYHPLAVFLPRNGTAPMLLLSWVRSCARRNLSRPLLAGQQALLFRWY